jgi:hypothetical protein
MRSGVSTASNHQHKIFDIVKKDISIYSSKCPNFSFQRIKIYLVSGKIADLCGLRADCRGKVRVQSALNLRKSAISRSEMLWFSNFLIGSDELVLLG